MIRHEIRALAASHDLETGAVSIEIELDGESHVFEFDFLAGSKIQEVASLQCDSEGVKIFPVSWHIKELPEQSTVAFVWMGADNSMQQMILPVGPFTEPKVLLGMKHLASLN